MYTALTIDEPNILSISLHPRESRVLVLETRSHIFTILRRAILNSPQEERKLDILKVTIIPRTVTKGSLFSVTCVERKQVLSKRNTVNLSLVLVM